MRLALGTAQFGLDYGIANSQGQVGPEQIRAILGHAADAGIDTLDTAIVYGDSEKRLGAIGVGRWKVISKLPALPPECSDIAGWVYSQTDACLKQLGIPRLRSMLLHRPADLLSATGEALYGALRALKKKGLIETIGISIYDPAELDELVPGFAVDIVQAPFNIIDRRLIESGWIDELARNGVELHVRSVFLQGLLLMSRQARPAKFNRWPSLWDRWEGWLEETGLSPLCACIRYALSFPGIAKVVIGVDSLMQLKQILDAMDGPMPAVPPGLACHDPGLLNPARWAAL